MDCVLKFLIDLLVLGPVRQIQDVFLLTLNVTTEYNYTEPALLTGLLMNILSVPLTLLTRDLIYLQKKRKCASKEFKDYPIHIVEVNQSMHDICQLYGIRLKYLYKLNKMSADHVPTQGEILRIR